MTNRFFGRTATELEQNITALEATMPGSRLLDLAWDAYLATTAEKKPVMFERFALDKNNWV